MVAGLALGLVVASSCLGAAAEPAGAAAAVGAAPGAEPPSCQNVRFSDVGWTDVTATTALTAQLLRSIGYTPTITVLSVPVTFTSMQNKDVDVFLGNWMPAQEADRAPYLANGSVVVVGANLEGAKYTLAVPRLYLRRGLARFQGHQAIRGRRSTKKSTASRRVTTATVWC